MVSFGTRIKVMRTIRDISQTALAKAVGISQYDISAFENDRALPSHETLSGLQTALKVNFSYPITIHPDGVLECSLPEQSTN